jgi:hypothetical protein
MERFGANEHGQRIPGRYPPSGERWLRVKVLSVLFASLYLCVRPFGMERFGANEHVNESQDDIHRLASGGYGSRFCLSSLRLCIFA